MVTIARLNVDLTANDTQFVSSMENGRRVLRRVNQDFTQSLNNMGSGFVRLTGQVTGLNSSIGALVGGASLFYLSKQALDSAEAVSKMAEQLGLTTTEIQRFQYAATLSGTSTEQLTTGFAYLNRQIAEGKVPYSNLKQAIDDIANKMFNASTGTQRARLAYEAFGKAGTALIPFFLNGKEGLKALGDEAERLGAVLPEDTIQRAKAFKDQFEILGTVITKNFQAGLLKEFTDDSGKLRDIYTDPSFIEGVKTLGEAFGLAARGAIALVEAYQKASTVVATLGLAVGADMGLIDPDVYNAALQEARDRLDGKGSSIPQPPGSKGKGGHGGDPGSLLVQPQSQLEKYTASLNKETDAIGLSQKALAQQQAVIQATSAARTDYENHLRKSPELTAAEAQSIEDLSGRFYDLKKAQQDVEEFNRQFKQGFEDMAMSVFEGSKSIGDSLKDLIKTMAELILKQQILGPLMNQAFGSPGTGGVGGGLGGLFSGGIGGLLGGSQGGFSRLLTTGSSSFIGPLPMFDQGTARVPFDMPAMIHQNEAVLTPSQADEWRNGGSGGDTYNDFRGVGPSEVARLQSLIMSLAGPGRVEERVNDAQRRGRI